VILISCGIGLAIEMWKVKKALDITVDGMPGSVIPWRIRIKNRTSYTESKTREYDEMAYRYLSWLMFPLLGAYTMYALVYHPQKSWYSFVVSTLVSFIYASAFIAMTPQLFINYKLRSVAHMPWRTLMYKTLNTFIDDLFAFAVVRMPWWHRIACLRDDVVFFVFLYQWWTYGMDETRANEYGQVAVQDAAAAAAAAEASEERKNA